MQGPGGMSEQYELTQVIQEIEGGVPPASPPLVKLGLAYAKLTTARRRVRQLEQQIVALGIKPVLCLDWQEVMQRRYHS